MNLYINSSNSGRVIIRTGTDESVYQFDSPRQQDVFGRLKTHFDQYKLTPSDITSITVDPGPGSFTGTRVAVSIANALGFALSVPVNGQTTPVGVIYGQEPNITIKPSPR
jgi:tRNA A37 threonylcarbamoyladenosine modification protein TsaB